MAIYGMSVEQLIKADEICLEYGLTTIRQRKVVLAFIQAGLRKLDFTELAIRVNLHKPAVCRALDVLYTLGITTRTVNEDHHLKRWVHLTDRGNRLGKHLGAK